MLCFWFAIRQGYVHMANMIYEQSPELVSGILAHIRREGYAYLAARKKEAER